jgi:hypothetical protein
MPDKQMHQLMIGMSGSFDVILDGCLEKRRFRLNRSYRLYVCPMIWRGPLTSNPYDEGNYYRNTLNI